MLLVPFSLDDFITRDSDDSTMRSSSDLMFMDEASIREGMRKHTKQLMEAERKHVLSQLPAEYRNRFGTVGSERCHCTRHRRHVQILNPYQLRPGPLRAKWVKAFAEVSSMNLPGPENRIPADFQYRRATYLLTLSLMLFIL
jgi:hypothetical protein